ncbi:protein kinase [Embleya sp. NPDC008237]|uniref:serine/threonine-protein kinase n=1 Tax=Embleya sp. NPDC008237 TaxID=3363978 RepID=UPI0036E2ABF5
MPTPLAGRFTLVDPVGTGMSGTVWRAFDHRLGGYCAAKLVRPADAGLLLRVVREQGFRLEHPHVSSPYTWVADGDVLIAMELFEGGSLASLIRDHGALPQAYAGAILGQLLDALEHVHAVGLVHRDVKPANVLLEVTGQDRPRCLLGDFGLALPREGPRLTEAGHVVGTWGYLPPEASTGAPPDVRRDLYASGILAWQLLTGSEDPPDGPPDFPVDGGPLWDLVRTLTEPEPGARPADAATASARLREIVPGLGPVTPATTEDGEPIEVFDVLGPLPEGAPEGSVLRDVERTSDTWQEGRRPSPRGASSAARVGAHAPEPAAELPPVPPTPPEPAAELPPVPPTPPEPAVEPSTPVVAPEAEAPSISLWLRAAERNAADPIPVSATPFGAAENRGASRRVGRRGTWVIVGAVLAVAAATAAVLTSGGGGAEDPVGPGPTSPPSAPVPSAAHGGGSSGKGTVDPPASRVSTAVPEEIVPGGACNWYEVSAEAPVPGGGRVRCTYREDGAYRWIPIPAS